MPWRTHECGTQMRKVTISNAWAVLLCLAALIAFGPYLWPIEPSELNLRNKDLRPVYMALWGVPNWSWAHPLGTDNLGRDTLANLIHGGRVTFVVAILAMGVSLIVGATVGALAGYFRALDGVLMRVTDLGLSLPLLPVLLLLLLVLRDPLRAQFGPETGIFILLVIAIGITSWMPVARIIRAEVLSLKTRDYVTAARSLGAGHAHILVRHILPNLWGPLMVSAALGVGMAILTESALSFLGLGFPSDYPTWGKLLFDNTSRMSLYPERVIWPGLMISVTVLAANYVGDGRTQAR